MRRFVALLLVLAANAALYPMTGHGQPSPRGMPPRSGPPEGWPNRIVPPDVAFLNDDGSLPKPSLTEPFAIGEALHNPGRVAQGVVSVLSLMGIEVIPDSPVPSPTLGRARLRLPESEVRALIAMGVRDAEAQAQDPAGPFTFRDLHSTLASSLKDVSVEGLAEMYAMEYEAHPDRLVNQVLLGQPLEPDTPLLRTELWLLLVDGVLTPGPNRTASRRGPRLVLARAGGAQATGLAPILMRTFQSPDGRRWRRQVFAELLVRLPLIMASSITLTRVVGHEGHGGPGQTVTVEARLNAPTISIADPDAPPLVPQQSTLAGNTVTWLTDSTIRKHVPGAQPSRRVTVGADGVARLPLTLKAEPARGRGQRLLERGLAELTVDLDQLVRQTYGLIPFDPFGEVTPATTVGLEWHAADTLEVAIANLYDVGSPAIGLTRVGMDLAAGTLALEQDGVYRGVVTLTSLSTTRLPGKTCVPGAIAGQFAEVVATPITENETPGQTSGAFYSSGHPRSGYTWVLGQPSKYLRLEFFPATDPRYSTEDPCQDEIPGPQSRSTPNFIPLNDAQWTIEGLGNAGGREVENRAGISIAVPQAGTQPAVLSYTEQYTPGNRQLLSAAGLGGLVKADSSWYVTVTHTKVN